jgi:hypothetical protein
LGSGRVSVTGEDGVSFRSGWTSGSSIVGVGGFGADVEGLPRRCLTEGVTIGSVSGSEVFLADTGPVVNFNVYSINTLTSRLH